ncbi:MAG TPA: hypothetical protein DCG75_18645 [Bacteroidales bacterium]|nr:hypothetical protein [Bacteroidales bacterium]
MELLSALIGGLIGGVLGVVGSILSSYYGPRKFEEWKEKRMIDKYDNPRKELLQKLLGGDFKIRSIETLSRVTGTTNEECRRLLIEIKARGIKIKGNREGWVLIMNKPLNVSLENEEDDDVE